MTTCDQGFVGSLMNASACPHDREIRWKPGDVIQLSPRQQHQGVVVLQRTRLAARDLRQPHLYDVAVAERPAAGRGAFAGGRRSRCRPRAPHGSRDAAHPAAPPPAQPCRRAAPNACELGRGGSAGAEQRGRPSDVIDDGGADDEPGRPIARLLLSHGTGQSALHPAWLMCLGFRDFSPGIPQAQEVVRRVTIRQRLIAESVLWAP